MKKLPHPIPYQGSKRHLAAEILHYFPSKIKTLYEPFAGSAAISIAAASNNLANHYHINDLNEPLTSLFFEMIYNPATISDMYKHLWYEQLDNPKEFYQTIRTEFNATGRADYFLYLLARCVKASIRYNSKGEFNQSADNRRKGARPDTMRNQIFGVSYLLKDRATVTSNDYRSVLSKVRKDDLVYMDPPYQGVCGNRDSRYLKDIGLT